MHFFISVYFLERLSHSSHKDQFFVQIMNQYKSRFCSKFCKRQCPYCVVLARNVTVLPNLNPNVFIKMCSQNSDFELRFGFVVVHMLRCEVLDPTNLRGDAWLNLIRLSALGEGAMFLPLPIMISKNYLTSALKLLFVYSRSFMGRFWN